MSSAINYAQGYNRLPDASKDSHFPSYATTTAPIPPPRRIRRYCCCFRTRGGCCAAFCCFFLIIIIGLVLLGFFAFPRQPKVIISDPYIPVGSKGFQEIGEVGEASKEKPFVAVFDMAINGSVYSPNYFSLQVDEINIRGNLIDEQGNKTENAVAGGSVFNTNFKAFENTTFVLPITLNYTVTAPENLLTDKSIILMLKSCGVFPGSHKKDLKLEYTTTFTIPFLQWTGYKPSFTGKLNFPCPNTAANAITKVMTSQLLLPVNTVPPKTKSTGSKSEKTKSVSGNAVDVTDFYSALDQVGEQEVVVGGGLGEDADMVADEVADPMDDNVTMEVDIDMDVAAPVDMVDPNDEKVSFDVVLTPDVNEIGAVLDAVEKAGYGTQPSKTGKHEKAAKPIAGEAHVDNGRKAKAKASVKTTKPAVDTIVPPTLKSSKPVVSPAVDAVVPQDSVAPVSPAPSGRHNRKTQKAAAPPAVVSANAQSRQRNDIVPPVVPVEAGMAPETNENWS
ncbi:hypothetical protein BC829DRAFT_394731 [Chytridium lagenaria]|nr:hypothetical protein BC829DRAFT_394731 [Chytridium lagenaria]